MTQRQNRFAARLVTVLAQIVDAGLRYNEHFRYSVAHDGAAGGVEERQQMADRLTRKRILIVEDEFIVAMNIAHEVATWGGVVVGPLATVDGALKAIKSADVDGAILDINLRGTPAFPVADALANRHLPFVFATGYPGAVVPARHANVRCFEKPTPPQVICSALEAAMSTNPSEE